MPWLGDLLATPQVRIPVRYTKDGLCFFYGGPLPVVEEHALGELLVPEFQIKDARRKQLLTRETERVLVAKTEPLFAHVKPPDDPSEWFADGPSMAVEATVDIKASPYVEGRFVQIDLFSDLKIDCSLGKKNGTHDVACKIPKLNLEARSLNHAYTLISQKLEPQRRSHTGNVFEKVYCAGTNKRYYQLSARRQTILAEEEVRIAVLWRRWWLHANDSRWAVCLPTSEGEVALLNIENSSTVTFEKQFDSEAEAEEFLREAHFVDIDTIGPSKFPPEPPYKRRDGSSVTMYLRVDPAEPGVVTLVLSESDKDSTWSTDV